MPEPDPWLLDEIEALAGKAEKDGATPRVASPEARKSEAAATAEPAVASAAANASESSGTRKPANATEMFVARKPPSTSESSGTRKPTADPTGTPKPVSRSATAALVGIGDDLIANASADDKPVFASSLEAARKGGEPRREEPAVFDELGLAKTPAVITGQTVREMPTTSKGEPDPLSAAAAAQSKTTDEGFPVPPPPRSAAPRDASPQSAIPATTSTSRSAKPMSRWTPHVLIGTLGLASIVAIVIRCSGSPAGTAQAEPNKQGAVAKLGDGARGDAREVANANAGAGADTVEGDARAGEPAHDGAVGADARDEVEGEAAGAKADDAKTDDAKADDAKADGGDAAASGGDSPSAAAAGGDDGGDAAAAGDTPKDAAAAEGAQDGAEPTTNSAAAKRDRPGKDATPASTSKSKPRSPPKPIEPSAPSPDANLTAEELLELARKAWKAGNAREAYKYANKSRYKKRSAEATEIATLAACKLKLEKSAKSSFDGLSGDKRRKVRQKCREWGVWVGL